MLKSKINTYREKSGKIKEKIFHPALCFLYNAVLACLFVIPLIINICKQIPFTYEVNDDAVIAQILDGSYTGTPDAHSIFVRYPFSYIMKLMYQRNPDINVGNVHLTNINWYVGIIIILETVALVLVLFRLFNYFQSSRLLIGVLYDCIFLYLWLPCFSNVTFSTAAAFLGCMSLLFLGFARKEEIWRPWNLLMLWILSISSYCLRKECFYMIIPFLFAELLYKYRTDFLHFAKPWFVFTGCLVIGVVIVLLNSYMYKDASWKEYFAYNHQRAYLQDYSGVPDYEKNSSFYQSIKMTKERLNSFMSYNYCLDDEFSQKQVNEVYKYQKQKMEDKNVSVKEKIRKAQKKALRYFLRKNQSNERLKFYGIYIWILVIPLWILTFIFKWKAGWKEHVLIGIEMAVTGFILMAEWTYLAYNGRFPQRVEETIRILTLCSGILICVHIMDLWKDFPFSNVSLVLELLIIGILFAKNPFMDQIKQIQGSQTSRQEYCKDKGLVTQYCGRHKTNNYVLLTTSFNKPSLPEDDLHQGNWFMSGSWITYSPLYEEKMEQLETDSLGTDFLTKTNTYIISKGKKSENAILSLMVKEQTDNYSYIHVDEITVGATGFYEVYQIIKK